MLKETYPKIKKVAFISEKANPATASPWAKITQALDLEVQRLEVRTAEDFDKAFEAILGGRAQAITVSPHPMLNAHLKLIVEFAAKNRLPAIYPTRESIDAGGLMFYGVNFSDLFRRAATYVDKILKGAKPAELPVERPTKFELLINLKAAKQIGLTIPPNVLARADKVIK